MRFAVLVVSLACMVHGGGTKAAMPVDARAEVEALLTQLADSGCQFDRNGSWHDAREASAHIRKKLDYLDRKGRLHSAEDFIAMAGTESSQTGKPYQVRCGSAPVQASAVWLKARLRGIRQTRQKPGP